MSPEALSLIGQIAGVWSRVELEQRMAVNALAGEAHEVVSAIMAKSSTGRRADILAATAGVELGRPGREQHKTWWELIQARAAMVGNRRNQYFHGVWLKPLDRPGVLALGQTKPFLLESGRLVALATAQEQWEVYKAERARRGEAVDEDRNPNVQRGEPGMARALLLTEDDIAQDLDATEHILTLYRAFWEASIPGRADGHGFLAMHNLLKTGRTRPSG